MSMHHPTPTAADNPAALMWGSGGRAYDDVSFAISDALKHGAERLAARPGEAVLDVATGTGWTARNIARHGAEVSAVDFARPLLDAARELSSHVRPKIAFHEADAERLPFEDGAFDRVISTFGVMFAADQRQAAAELARVCKPGGRLVLVNWVPGGSVERFFDLLGAHDVAPPPASSPLAWGDPARLQDLLGQSFELALEPGTNHAYYDDEAAIWEWYARGFGPVRSLLAKLDPASAAALRREVDAYHAAYRTEAGLHVVRDYLVVIGRRR